jgi:hypothetical protein
MKVVLTFLLLVVALVKGADGTHANARMFLAGTNNFIGQINFYMEQEDWGVVISGSVNGLRPLAVLVSRLSYFTSLICQEKKKVLMYLL